MVIRDPLEAGLNTNFLKAPLRKCLPKANLHEQCTIFSPDSAFHNSKNVWDLRQMVSAFTRRLRLNSMSCKL
jgi:hypothetical protein